MSKVHNIFAVDFCQTLVNIDSLPCFIKFVCLEAKGKRTFYMYGFGY